MKENRSVPRGSAKKQRDPQQQQERRRLRDGAIRRKCSIDEAAELEAVEQFQHELLEKSGGDPLLREQMVRTWA